MSRLRFNKLFWVAVCLVLLVVAGTLSAQRRGGYGFERAREAQERHTERLLAVQGVEGTAVGLDENGQHQVRVFTARQGVGGIPRNLEGVPVEVVVTGKFYALANPLVLPAQAKRPPTDRTPPAAPTGLTAKAISSSQINLSWKDNANNENGFKIERKSTGSFGQIATVGANKTSYSNTGLAPSTGYTYRVRAYNNAGNSDYSNEASATTPVAPLPPLWCQRPVPIGVSTGNALSNSAGTIGCRVKDGAGNVYALSNNHVYALENKAPFDSEVLQPGRYDGGVSPRDVIGTLTDFEPIVFSRWANNKIDAAIAISGPDLLGNGTPGDGYGIPSSTTAMPYVDMRVQKYGRTTSLTRGTITGTNVIVNVGYNSGTARFVNQIIVESDTAFIGAGDSGSLLVTDDLDKNKNPVGLLFAGTSDGTLAVANPIGAVLGAFGVIIDGE